MKEQTKTVLGLIEHQLERGTHREELESTIYVVHIIFFLKEQLRENCSNDINYIGSEDFHRLISTIDSNKLKLIKEITNL